MDTTKRSPLDRLLFATFLKGRTSSRDIWEEKGDMTPEDNQKIIEGHIALFFPYITGRCAAFQKGGKKQAVDG